MQWKPGYHNLQGHKRQSHEEADRYTVRLAAMPGQHMQVICCDDKRWYFDLTDHARRVLQARTSEEACREAEMFVRDMLTRALAEIGS